MNLAPRNISRNAGAGGAFTLIEMMAVMAIVSLIAVLATAGLASTDRAAKFLSAEADLRELDQRARLLARTSGVPVVIRIDSEHQLLELLQPGMQQAVVQTQYPPELTIAIWGAKGREVPDVIVNCAGRSPDYTASIGDQTRQIRLTVAGLTGLIGRQEAIP